MMTNRLLSIRGIIHFPDFWVGYFIGTPSCVPRPHTHNDGHVDNYTEKMTTKYSTLARLPDKKKGTVGRGDFKFSTNKQGPLQDCSVCLLGTGLATESKTNLFPKL